LTSEDPPTERPEGLLTQNRRVMTESRVLSRSASHVIRRRAAPADETIRYDDIYVATILNLQRALQSCRREIDDGYALINGARHQLAASQETLDRKFS
jgi:hypothetical protein